MKHAFLSWLCLGWLLAVPARAQNMARGTLYARADGTDVKLALEIRIERGWHLYHGPTQEDVTSDGEGGKPTTVQLHGEGVEWGPLRFPKPDVVEEKFAENEPATHFREHHGTIVIYARGKMSSGASLDAIGADVTGLTCQDNGVCIPYEEKLKVEGPGPDAIFKAFPADLAVAGASASASLAATPDPDGETSLWLFLASAVWWGLWALLMPCTYPMIPITISYFTKQATQRHTGTLPLSLCYGVGIVAVFVLIGIVVGPLIILFAAHPVTNLVIGSIFLLFALVLFGVVELQAPRFLLDAAGNASTRGGYLGVFLMGATLVVTSFTCTAPFVGTLLAQGASSGGLGRVALGMAVFGLTMAIPFVMLSMVPAKVKAMPTSGEWMHVLKVTLGFVEIAAALKFFSNVDLVWQWGFLSRELFLFFWMGIFVVAAVYLFGLIRLKDERTTEISPGRMTAGLFFTLFALYCGYGALGNGMDPIMTAIIPNYSGRIAGMGYGGASSSSLHTIIKDDYEGALDRARAEGKLLLVNFTGFT
jgi:thiol:disulfide interchange protein